MSSAAGYALRVSQMQGQLRKDQRAPSGAARRERVPDGFAARVPALRRRQVYRLLTNLGREHGRAQSHKACRQGPRQCCSKTFIALLGETIGLLGETQT
jgi:hypothetical protein